MSSPGGGTLVAVVTDGTAVLGLGDIGPEAGMPVMEGKCVLFKAFGGVDAVPPVRQEPRMWTRFVQTVYTISGSFGGVNLEDISAPRCFEIERKLKEMLRYPGVPRRPARHGRHRPGRPHQRPAGWWARRRRT